MGGLSFATFCFQHSESESLPHLLITKFQKLSPFCLEILDRNTLYGIMMYGIDEVINNALKITVSFRFLQLKLKLFLGNSETAELNPTPICQIR